MPATGCPVRLLMLALASVGLTSCEPKSIPIGTCLVGSRLAFWLGDTRRWFFVRTKARPWKITVYEPYVGPAWATRVPYELAENWQHTYQPKRNIVIYGETYRGWEVETAAQPLKRGRKYSVEIWTDGGQGLIEIVAGEAVPQCSAANR